MTREPESVGEVLRWMLRDPVHAIGRRWNYKAALLSATTRGCLFFLTNSPAGRQAATAALVTEFVFRFAASGFFGAMTQAFRNAKPERVALLTAMFLLPCVSHLLELAVHWLRGTPRLSASIAASVCFTAFSTAFHLFAMRRGALIVGDEQRSLLADLRSLPGLVVSFLAQGARNILRSVP